MKRFVRRVLRKLGFEVHYVGRGAASSGVAGAAPPPPGVISASSVSPYVENPESGPVDFAEKLQRERNGEPFEWPNIVALNRAIIPLLGDAKRIAELGGGTGGFAWEASADLSRTIVSSELDAQASRWAREHRSRPNITYLARPLTPADPDASGFDLVVSVEVIEHVADFNAFLATCVALAPRAILTTPNRTRGPRFDTSGPPETKKHVREWTAGEFYWVLRTRYRDVRLYAQPNPYASELVPIRVTDTLSPVIADCREPL